MEIFVNQTWKYRNHCWGFRIIETDYATIIVTWNSFASTSYFSSSDLGKFLSVFALDTCSTALGSTFLMLVKSPFGFWYRVLESQHMPGNIWGSLENIYIYLNFQEFLRVIKLFQNQINILYPWIKSFLLWVIHYDTSRHISQLLSKY